MNTKAVLVLTVVIVLAAAGSAVAYLTAAGSGSGAGQSSTVASVVLTPGTGASTLYPGGVGTVTTSATSTVEVRVPSLELDTALGTGGFSVDAGHSGCTLSSLSFTTQTNGGAGWTVPAVGSLPITLPGSLALSASAPNTCQGAVVTVHLKVGS